MGAMKTRLRRFSEEAYYYSSQLVVLFVVIIFLTSGSLSMGITSSLIIVFFMIAQIMLLVSQGHLPLLRFLFSLITPLGYSILRAATSNYAFTETTSLLLWAAAIYIGFFQAVSLSFPQGFIKRIAETALSLGSAVIFFAFYYYLDLRISLQKAYEMGEISLEVFRTSLQIGSFAKGLQTFITSPQHLFALLGIISFDTMLLASRMRSISLHARLDAMLAQKAPGPEQVPAEESTFGQDIRRDSGPVRLIVSAVSSDIISFSSLSEMLGAQKAADFLNRYYALWTHAASPLGGRIISTGSDSVIVLFGLVDETNQADRALQAVYDFMDKFSGLKEDLAELALPNEVRISIGVHTGSVVAATLGPPGEQKKTVFGDTIAVAARLDSLCREMHQEILVSHSTYRRLSLEQQATLDRIGEVLLRQSSRPVPVYTKK